MNVTFSPPNIIVKKKMISQRNILQTIDQKLILSTTFYVSFPKNKMSLACYFHTSIIHQIFECFFYLRLMNIVFDYERQGFVWFILILDFNLTICYLYFKILVEVFTNHILAENTYFTNHTK